MFPTSTQFKHWTFSGNTQLTQLKTTIIKNYTLLNGKDMTEEDRQNYFLTLEEEKSIKRHYEYVLKQFCSRFEPAMPNYVMATAMVYFKRFYLQNSAMDYHPKDILFTCIYLACKVEEFNVSIQQFVKNCLGNREKAADIILSHELLLMHELQYHLTVHNPYRPMEGLLIDIKTRSHVEDAEKVRRVAEEFLDKSWHTDVCLLFAPSQIALAAILSGAAKAGINLDNYLKNILFGCETKENLLKAIENIKRIRYNVKNQDPLDRDDVKKVEQKLEICRNQENNPDSQIYKDKLRELWEEEQEVKKIKRVKKAEVATCENPIDLMLLDT